MLGRRSFPVSTGRPASASSTRGGLSRGRSTWVTRLASPHYYPLDLELSSRCTVAAMNVSELAREVGIAPSAVRFYERRGILPAAPRHGNGYRRYSDDDLCRLRVVVSLRRLGLELSTAGRLAALCQAGECDVMARDLGPLIADQRTAIARTKAELDELDGHLMEVQAMLAANP